MYNTSQICGRLELLAKTWTSRRADGRSWQILLKNQAIIIMLCSLFPTTSYYALMSWAQFCFTKVGISGYGNPISEP